MSSRDTRDQGGYSPGRAVRRSPPASLGCRRRSHQRDCRQLHWHRHKSHCSSGPRFHWDKAGSSPGPATLGRGQRCHLTLPSITLHPFPHPQAASLPPQLPRTPSPTATGFIPLLLPADGPTGTQDQLWRHTPPRPGVGFQQLISFLEPVCSCT